MWHDQRWATSVVPATIASRRRPREARATLMSRTSSWSKPDTIEADDVAASATGVDAGANTISGALAAAEARRARRSRGGRKQDIWDVPMLGRDKVPAAR